MGSTITVYFRIRDRSGRRVELARFSVERKGMAMTIVNLLVVAISLTFKLDSPSDVDEHRQDDPPNTLQGAEDKTSDVVKPLLGSWKNVDDGESLVRIEPTKCSFARLGKPGIQIVRAKFEPGQIFANFGARKLKYLFELKDGTLSLTSPDGKKKTFLKLDKTPMELEAKALKLGAVLELPKTRIQSIQSDLARRGELDQAVRTDKKFNQMAKVDADNMAKVDADNTEFLVKLVQELGWVDVERFGAKTSNEAFLIVQHSGHLPLMLAALPFIEKDVKAKRLDVQPYALLYDRLQVNLGERQRFGTQIGFDDKGAMVVQPLVDRKRVEEFRKEIGLFPLTVYLKFFEKQNGGKPIEFQDE
jgi:hypothetical protein